MIAEKKLNSGRLKGSMWKFKIRLIAEYKLSFGKKQLLLVTFETVLSMEDYSENEKQLMISPER